MTSFPINSAYGCGHWQKRTAIFVSKIDKGADMNVLIIITTNDGETIYNAMRLANTGVKKGDQISVFMLGKGVLFEQAGSEEIDVMGQVNAFEGDFYV